MSKKFTIVIKMILSLTKRRYQEFIMLIDDNTSRTKQQSQNELWTLNKDFVTH